MNPLAEQPASTLFIQDTGSTTNLLQSVEFALESLLEDAAGKPEHHDLLAALVHARRARLQMAIRRGART